MYQEIASMKQIQSDESSKVAGEGKTEKMAREK